MTGRERVRSAMDFRPVDIAPLQYFYVPVGYYEHGEKLNDLFSTLPGDFEPFSRKPIPIPGPEEYEADGTYHSFERDEWGTLRERRIFGVWGIPSEYPLHDLGRLDSYRPPQPPALSGSEFDALCEAARAHKNTTTSCTTRARCSSACARSGGTRRFCATSRWTSRTSTARRT